MTLRRKAINLLDRTPTRGLLGRLATSYSRHRLGIDTDIFFHDCCWMHRFEGRCYVDGPKFVMSTPRVLDLSRTAPALKGYTEDYWFHKYRPAPGDTIIDVGAGIGADTLFFSEAVGPTGRVIAIEAHPRTFRMLQATRHWNALDNVTAIHRAIVDRPREVFIQDEEEHEANAISFHQSADKHLPSPIPGGTLDDLCRELNVKRADMIKMNIEGAERFALEGMREITKTARNICIASHDFRGGEDGGFSTRKQVVEFLKSMGFEVSSRDQDPRGYVRDHIHGVRPNGSSPTPGAIES